MARNPLRSHRLGLPEVFSYSHVQGSLAGLGTGRIGGFGPRVLQQVFGMADSGGKLLPALLLRFALGFGTFFRHRSHDGLAVFLPEYHTVAQFAA